MGYEHYTESRNLAWSVLIETETVRFPVALSRLLDFYRIKAVLNPELLGDCYARSLLLNDQPYIILRNAEDKNRFRFSTAHELGHILLGHIQDLHEQEPITEEQEKDANVFASRLLMPSVVCKVEGLTAPEQIAEFFGVSLESARIRAERIGVLLARDKWLTSPLERAYLRLYQGARKKAENAKKA